MICETVVCIFSTETTVKSEGNHRRYGMILYADCSLCITGTKNPTLQSYLFSCPFHDSQFSNTHASNYSSLWWMFFTCHVYYYFTIEQHRDFFTPLRNEPFLPLSQSVINLLVYDRKVKGLVKTGDREKRYSWWLLLLSWIRSAPADAKQELLPN